MPTGPKGEKRPRDANQLAKLIVDIATGQVEDREPTARRTLEDMHKSLFQPNNY